MGVFKKNAEKVGNQYIITKAEVNKAVKEQRKKG